MTGRDKLSGLNKRAKVDWRSSMREGITTDSLWLTSKQKKGKYFLEKNDLFSDFDRSFHGLFIPEIPYQFIRRYAMHSGWVWDPFAGGNTTYYVAEKLGIQERVIASDISPKKDTVHYGDARLFDPLEYTDGEEISLSFVHPPYFGIIQFEGTQEDISTSRTLDEYYRAMFRVAENVYRKTIDGGHVILVCGNVWEAGEEIDLGVFVKEQFRKAGFKCRSHIIKDYGETKNSKFGKGYNLQYYRNLRNDTNFFYGDNIFVLKK